MDPRFLPFQIAAGILWAGLIILLLKLGMNIFRNNAALRGWFGGGMFVGGLILAWWTMLAGFNY
jgi:hypothetical protein